MLIDAPFQSGKRLGPDDAQSGELLVGGIVERIASA
jgi:hypothetical protein